MDKLCCETCISNFANIDKFFSWVWQILSVFFFTVDNPSFCPVSTRGSIFPDALRRIPVSMLCLLHGCLKFLLRRYGSFQRVHVRTRGDPEITAVVRPTVVIHSVCTAVPISFPSYLKKMNGL